MLRKLLRSALPTLALVTLASAAQPEAKPLFDGKSTEGWTEVGGKKGNWLVENGLLITRGEGGGWLSTNKTYGDFLLKLEYRVGPGGNSGVFIRSPRTGDPAYTGMELQVLDDDHPMYKDLKPFQYTGSVYGVVAAKRGHTKAPGEWNQMEVHAKGPKVVVKLNGTVIVDADLSQHPDAVKTHPGILRKDGYIGLQSHSDPVQYRNITIEELN